MSLSKLFSKTKTQQSENINAIKDFFFYHHGDGMSMHRDDPEKYKQYRFLKEDTVEQWRQELIAQDFELLINDNVENQWILIGNLIRLISSSKNLIEDNFKKLLTQIIEMSSTLSKRQRILILEHFAGRTLSQEDDAIYLIYSKTTLTELLITAVNTLANFSIDTSDNLSDIGWEDMKQRYNDAQKDIQNAFKKFKIK